MSSDAVRKTVTTGERLIVGLGNPGDQYEGTRHNLGFRVVAELARRWQASPARLECSALVRESKGRLLVEPQTYMNRSGYAVRCLVERGGLIPENILVVYDDVNLALGRLRLRTNGGPGGHRGMESILQNLQTEDIPRLRLGISLEGAAVSEDDLVDFVLSTFTGDEEEIVQEMIQRAADACDSWLEEGSETTMNRFNG